MYYLARSMLRRPSCVLRIAGLLRSSSQRGSSTWWSTVSMSQRKQRLQGLGGCSASVQQQLSSCWRHMSTSAKMIKKRREPKKKYKLKSYSSFKGRFKLLPNGTYLRYRAGKRHHGACKTPKRRRQLRRPAIVHKAYARVMKKLGFKG